MESGNSNVVTGTTGTTPPSFGALLTHLRSTISGARRHALRAVNVLQVQTCWELGRHIVEYEQGGADRAQYGAGLLKVLAETLTAEFGRGFDVSNLRYIRLFYKAFPIRDAVRHELSWTHYRTLLKVENSPARLWYMNEAADQTVGAVSVCAGHTRVIPYHPMKVAISLPDPLFSAAELMAEQLHVSRSQLYAQALSEYLDKRQEAAVTQRLNAVHGASSEGVDPAIKKAQLKVLGNETW